MGHNSYGLWTPTFSQGDVVYDAGSVVGPPSTLALFAVGLDDRPRAVVSVRSLDPDEFGGGQVVETRRGDIVGRGYFFTPFGPRQLIAFGPAGAAAEAISSMYDVAWWGLAGDTLRIGDGRTEGPRLTDDEQALGEERLGRTRESVRQQGGTFRLTLPSHKPPLANLYFDRDGRLWVELSVSEDAPREADVYDSGGVLVERRRWPERVRIANPGWIRGDVALGVTVDSLGVQRVVRVEW